jgi:Homeodomain
MSERGANFDGSSQQGRYLGGDSIIGGTFDMSEGEGRFKPGETSGGKKRRSRATQEQLDILNGVYQRTPFPTTVERTELAQQLGMTPRSVQIW